MDREVAVVVRRADEFLVLHRAADRYWHVVAAAIESGETPAVAAARELCEETGLAVRPSQLDAGRFVDADGAEAHVTSFEAVASPGWEPTLNDEHDDYRWCTPVAASALLRWSEPKELIDSLSVRARR